MESVNNKVDELIDYIKNTSDYKMCLKLKSQMNDNKELIELINEIKKLQKKYIRSNYDDSLKKELDEKNEKLLNIPLYVVYNQHLSRVNEMIDYVKDSLNEYFYNLLNNK